MLKCLTVWCSLFLIISAPAGAFSLNPFRHTDKASPVTDVGEDFNRDILITKAVKLSKEPYEAPADNLPQELKDLSYDQYRDIRFVRENGPWYGKRLPFEVQFFSSGLFVSDHYSH